MTDVPKAYPRKPAVVKEMPLVFVGTTQPDWELLYPARATPTAEHGMTNAGAAVTAAEDKTVVVVASDSVPSPRELSDPTTGRIVIPTNGKNWLLLKPIGVGANNGNIPMAVWAWRSVQTPRGNALDVEEFHCDPICHFDAILCSKTGVSGARVNENWRFCDEFTNEVYRGVNTTGFGSTEHPSAPDDAPAYCYFDVAGAQYVEIEGVVDGETRWNALYCFI